VKKNSFAQYKNERPRNTWIQLGWVLPVPLLNDYVGNWLTFYIDPEKKKYFRIQANHVAPAGSQHSEQAVKKRKKESEVIFLRP